MYAAGYNIAPESLEETMDEFNDIIGINRLKLVHLNDSKGILESRIDRHEHIGMGGNRDKRV